MQTEETGQRTEDRRRIAVVGGGIAGLAAAFQLKTQLPTINVQLFEKSGSAGGFIRTKTIDGRHVELGPNGFLDSKTEILSLCRELKLELESADSASAERFIEIDGQLRKVPGSPGEFLKSDVLSIRGKLRFLAERFMGRESTLPDESIAEFGRRHFGREATENLLDGVATGIFAGDIQKLSIRSCFPRLIDMERRFGSLLKAQGAIAKEKRQRGEKPGLGTLTCPVGGMGRLSDALSERMGNRLKVGIEVQRIEQCREGWEVHWNGGSAFADAVMIATPAHIAAGMVEDQPLRHELSSIVDVPAVVVSLAFKRADLTKTPTGFGFIIPERLGRAVLGVIFSGNVFPKQSLDGEFNMRAILGGDRRKDVVEWTDQQLIDEVRKELRSLVGIEAKPCFAFVQRWSHAIPQYHVGHEARLERIDETLKRLPGLFLTGASYRGVAAGDCVRDGIAVAEQAALYLQQPSRREPLP